MINTKIPLSIIPTINNNNPVFCSHMEPFHISTDRDLSLYIHFPFCLHKCAFCPIKTTKYNSHLVQKYLLALKNEIESCLKGIGYRRVDNIHFGGGTPSLLKVCELDDILNTIKRYADLEKAEIVFEAHPAFITDEMIIYLSRINNCTINFGVQSFDNTILSSMNRHCTSDDIIRTISFAKEKNCRVGIDYICDWPESDYKSIEHDISLLETIQPEHISQYPLRPCNSDNSYLDDHNTVATKNELNQYCEKRILDLGYQRYSISHYQRNGTYSHRYGRNQLFGGEWIGFGASAYSYFGDSVYINSNISEYINGNTLYEKTIHNKDKRLIWELVFLFRLNPLYRKDIIEKYGTVLEEKLDKIIKIFGDKGYIISEQNLSLNWRGIINIDCVERTINEVLSL